MHTILITHKHVMHNNSECGTRDLGTVIISGGLWLPLVVLLKKLVKNKEPSFELRIM